MNTGVQRVVRALHRALAAKTATTPLVWDPALASYCVLSDRERDFLERPFGKSPRRNPMGDAEPGRRANPVPILSKFTRRLVHRRNRIDLAACAMPGDAIFVPEIFQDNRIAWFTGLTGRADVRRVGVCHDALPYSQPGIIPPARLAGFTEYLNVLGGFDAVVTISQQSADDLRACWRAHGRGVEAEPPITIVRWPADHDGIPRRIVPPAKPVPGRSILTVGTFEPRKNHLCLLDAAELSWRRGGDFRLVLIGRTTAHFGAQVERRMEQLHKDGRAVHWLRHVDDNTLRRAYQECAFTVFPSLAEGLGLPILESLWHGRPCLCGQNGGIGEAAAGGGCLAVDQTNPEAMATAIETLLADQILYRRLCDEAAARHFDTWAELAARLLPILSLVRVG